jgi:monovalent cation:proton antiporter-2 (CPA2) family protein
MLSQAALFLAAAVVAVPLFKRLGLGSVLGYLAAGAVIGPSGLRLVRDVEPALHLAEFGVVLLLFLIGLELQPARLWRMRGEVFGLGALQLVATTVLIALLARLLGSSWAVAVVAGVALSMSSTAFALQLLGEKNELATPHGRTAFGILLFQDLAAIPTLALVPLLGTGVGSAQAPMSTGRAIAAVAVLATLVIAGRFLVRPVLRFIAAARSPEVSTAAALLVVVGTGLVMQAVGLSMAMGAFVAGVLLAGSEYRHELEANIEPFKGLLLGLFFLAVGMSARLQVLIHRPWTVAALVVALVVIKFAVLYAIGTSRREGRESTTSLGVALSQGGEFAFVIFGVARSAAVMSAPLSELLVVVVTISMMTTPLLFVARDRWLVRLAAAKEKPPFDTIQEEGSRVIIAGYGRFGQIVSRVLRVKGIPFTALEISTAQVDFVRRFGNKIYYGDASRVELLRAAHADRAEVFVLAIDDIESSMRTARTVREHFPQLKIVARARNRQHAYALLGLGIEVVIRETFADSLDAACETLEGLGFTSTAARRTVERFYQYDEAQVRQTFRLRDDERALIASTRDYAAELERVFAQDARDEAAAASAPPESPGREPPA